MEQTVVGWVNEANGYGVRVGPRWVLWAIGALARPYLGDYAEVAIDADGYAVGLQVLAWRPMPPTSN